MKEPTCHALLRNIDHIIVDTHILNCKLGKSDIMANDDNKKIADFYAWVTVHLDIQKVNFQSEMYVILISKILAFIMNFFHIIKYSITSFLMAD